MHVSQLQMAQALAQRRVSARQWQTLDTLVASPLINCSKMDGLAARCEQARTACDAKAAGISMFGTSSFDRLIWLVANGELSDYQGEMFPRQDSPCGFCFDYRSPQLFHQPHLYFKWMAAAGVEIDELLVVPIQGPFAAFFGTLWVAGCHERAGDSGEIAPGCFNRAHAQILEKLSTGIWSKLNSDPNPQDSPDV